MTISSEDRVAGPFAGNGVTTAFPFAFKVFSQDDLRVILTSTAGVETDQTLTTHYAVSLNADQNVSPGGTVTMVTAPASGEKLTVTTDIDSLQQVDMTLGGGFYPDVIENALDRVTMLIQQVEEKTDRAITVPISSGLGSSALPVAEASMLLGWNPTATGLQNYGPADTSALSAALAQLSGANLVGFGHATAFSAGTVGAAIKDRGISIKDAPYLAAGDGATNDATAIQSAIDALSTAGGGTIYFPRGTYLCNTGLTLKPKVRLVSDQDAQIKFGGASGTFIGSGTTTLLYEAGIVGVDLDSGTATTALLLNSPTFCRFADIRITANSATQVCIDVQTNGSGETNAWGNRNAWANDFDSIWQDGTCGTGLRLQGDGPTGGPPTAVVTLNSFRHILFTGVSVRGFDFAEWADSNKFTGIAYAYLIANNAVGCEHNTANPTGNHGVYANSFTHLAVDTFGVYTGRVALKLNYCKNILIDEFFNDPIAEGGDIVVSATDTYSYRIGHHKGGTNEIRILEKGMVHYGGAVFRGSTTETVGVEIGNGRTGDGASNLDLVGDATYTDFGARLIRNGGANGNTQLIHRGTGVLTLYMQDAGGAYNLTNSLGTVLVAGNDTGLGVFGAPPAARQTVTGSRGGNAALASLCTALANLGWITNSTTA